MRTYTQSQETLNFIKKAKKVHGEKYTYDNTIYVNSKTKVTITCPHHGSFEQTANSHLRVKGCPICGGTKKSTTEKFIAEAKQMHGDFEQTPNNHLNSQGCQHKPYNSF